MAMLNVKVMGKWNQQGGQRGARKIWRIALVSVWMNSLKIFKYPDVCKVQAICLCDVMFFFPCRYSQPENLGVNATTLVMQLSVKVPSFSLLHSSTSGLYKFSRIKYVWPS